MNIDAMELLMIGLAFWCTGWFMAWLAGAFKCMKDETQSEYLWGEPR